MDDKSRILHRQQGHDRIGLLALESLLETPVRVFQAFGPELAGKIGAAPARVVKSVRIRPLLAYPAVPHLSPLKPFSRNT
jgi:hypothetical protein